MRRRQFTGRCVVAAGAWLLAPGAAQALAEGDAAAGVRAALQRGAQAALARLGRSDGFLADPRVRIALPQALENVARVLRAAGQQRRLDELVTAMNRAAESAVPEARDVLLAAVRSTSVEDALGLVRGGSDAVTRFFERKTRAPLGDRFLPIVTRATERVALAERYDAVAGRARSLGLLPPEHATLPQHVTARALDGLYLVIGDEEAQLRQDPLGSGSALLKRVFGR